MYWTLLKCFYGWSNYPPLTYPPRNNGLIAGLTKGSRWFFISPDLRPYFWGGYGARGGRLTGHYVIVFCFRKLIESWSELRDIFLGKFRLRQNDGMFAKLWQMYLRCKPTWVPIVVQKTDISQKHPNISHILRAPKIEEIGGTYFFYLIWPRNFFYPVLQYSLLPAISKRICWFCRDVFVWHLKKKQMFCPAKEEIRICTTPEGVPSNTGVVHLWKWKKMAKRGGVGSE